MPQCRRQVIQALFIEPHKRLLHLPAFIEQIKRRDILRIVSTRNLQP